MTSPTAPQPANELDRALARLLADESLRPLMGGLAHHFNNILSGILGWASLAPTLPPATLATLSVRVKEQVEHASRLTRLVLSITRGAAESAGRVCELKHWSEDALALLKTATPSHVQLVPVLPEEELWAGVSPVAYTRLLLDLVLTAIQLSPASKPSEIRLRISREDGRCVVSLECPALELPDGPAPSIQELVALGNLTTAPLAWATASAIVRDLGGELAFRRVDGGAVAWVMRLPSSPASI
jgi:signal transduction histidine kinase